MLIRFKYVSKKPSIITGCFSVSPVSVLTQIFLIFTQVAMLTLVGYELNSEINQCFHCMQTLSAHSPLKDKTPFCLK